MRLGEVWLAHVGRKPRPVVVVTRDEVLDVRVNVTVAEITTTVRGLAVEVPIDPASGIERASVVNRDGLVTVSQRWLIQRFGSVDGDTLDEIREGVPTALGFDRYEDVGALIARLTANSSASGWTVLDGGGAVEQPRRSRTPASRSPSPLPR